MRINIIRCVLVLLLFCTFVVIFNFSSEDSEKSGSTSQKVTEEITKNIKSIQKLDDVKKAKVLDKIESVIRKIAHFSIYSLVGVLLMALLSTYNISDKNKIIFTIVLGTIYASSDEFHQSFIPGRSGEVKDVMLDTLGVAVGGLIVLAIIKLIGKIKGKIVKEELEQG